MKIEPGYSNVRFFSQSDAEGTMYADCLWRYISRDSLIFEHTWNANSKNWDMTTELTGMIVHGESSLVEISQQRAMDLVPDAFLKKESR
jgi:hypothetical protein